MKVNVEDFSSDGQEQKRKRRKQNDSLECRVDFDEIPACHVLKPEEYNDMLVLAPQRFPQFIDQF